MNPDEIENKLCQIYFKINNDIELTINEKKFMVYAFTAEIMMYGLLGFVYLLGTTDIKDIKEMIKNVNNGNNSTGENR